MQNLVEIVIMKYSSKLTSYASINFILTPPPPPPPIHTHDYKGPNTISTEQSLCTKNPPPGQNRESKAPPPMTKLENFTNVFDTI